MQLPKFGISGFMSQVFSLRPPEKTSPVPEINPETLGPKEIYLQWQAPVRSPLKSINKKFMRTLMVVGAVLGMLMILMQEFYVILFAVSVGFFIYVLGKYSIEDGTYEISSHGVSIGDKVYYWGNLRDFFVSIKGDAPVLVLETRSGLPFHLFIGMLPDNVGRVTEIMAQRIQQLKEEPKSFLDKIYESFISKFDMGS